MQLPNAVCHLKGLSHLMIEWFMPDPHESHATCGQHAALNSSQQYTVHHEADRLIQLPAQLSALSGLQEVSLMGDVSGASALAALSDLPRLRALVLGPGQLDMHALLGLGSSVLNRLHHLELRQQGKWDARILAATLHHLTQLKQLVIQELNPRVGAAATWQHLEQHMHVPPEEMLRSEDIAPLAASLASLTWHTGAWRMNYGTGLLARDGSAPWLGTLTTLRQLAVHGLPGPTPKRQPVLEYLDSSLTSCARLEDISIVGCGIPILPRRMIVLSRLRSVTIDTYVTARRVVSTTPEALAPLAGCRGLRCLMLAGCELQQLPVWLSCLTHLEQLKLPRNCIQALPNSPGLGGPPGVTDLDLSANRLRCVPASISHLSKLVNLNLSNNYLSDVPCDIWSLPVLQCLSVADNMLCSLPAMPVGDAGCSNGLRCLDASNNQLSILPASLSRLTGLQSLQLSHNHIRALPEGTLTALRGLTSLNVAGNYITRLPQALTALQHLEVLHAEGNYMQHAPSWVSKVSTLRQICVGQPKEVKVRAEHPCLLLAAKDLIMGILMDAAESVKSKLQEDVNLSYNINVPSHSDYGFAVASC